VSAVICTRDRPNKIGNAVRSVLANSHQDFDLTVVDQSATGETEAVISAIAATDARARLVRDDGVGLSRAYNIGIEASQGDILAFTDDDCLVPENWLSSIVEAFSSDPDAQLLYGQVLPISPPGPDRGLTPFLTIERPERLSRQDGFRVFGMGANFAARRSLFSAIGSFDEVLGGGGALRSSQDFDLTYRAYRAGMVILLRPEVMLQHDGHRDREDWPTLLRNYGVGDGGFYSKHVRCRDVLALKLLVRLMARKSMKIVVWTVLGRKADEQFYLRGVVEGIREGLKYDVDRAARRYRAAKAEGALIA
jgi:glycosyltransferase involved in cell wall biosynthesis